MNRPDGRGLVRIIRAVVVGVFVLALAACGGSDGGAAASAAPEVDVKGAVIPVDSPLLDVAFQIGRNGPGPLTLPPEPWHQLAVVACWEGGWDAAIAQDIADRFLTEFDPKRLVSLKEMTDTVWLITVSVCREVVPPKFLEAGPPSVSGG